MRSRDPLTLFTAHKVLIGFAIGLGAVLLLYGVIQYRATGSMATLATGIAGAVLGGGLVFYLRWFIRKRRVR